MNVGESFTSKRKSLADPVTGRRIIQLTAGDCFDYPLYYFIPSMTPDSRAIIFHRLQDGDLQLYRLDVATGLTVRLTRATTRNALWRPYLQPEATGVRGLLSAFNTETSEVVYFDSNDIRAVHIESLEDRHLYTVAEDRVPCGLTGVSPDGKWFVFVHADRPWWEAHVGHRPDPTTSPERHTAVGTRLDVLNLATGEVRTLVQINSWLTHSNFYDNFRILFSHPSTDSGVLMTDLRGGYYQHLRTQDELGSICHHVPTARGMMYEIAGSNYGGLYNLDDHSRVEFDLGLKGYMHTGADPEGRLWFADAHGPSGRAKAIYYFDRLKRGVTNTPVALTSEIRTYWVGQRAHLHPRITPDRRWILFTGGDPANETNHLFLLDIGDLEDTVLDMPSEGEGFCATNPG